MHTLTERAQPAMQLQVVCDWKVHFLNVCTGWPMSVHDSRVFNNIPLKSKLEALPSQGGLPGPESIFVGHIQEKWTFDSA